MEQSEKSELHNRIRAEINATENTIKNLIELTKPVAPDSALGRLTRLDAIGSKSINEASLRKTRDKLNKLRHAMANLDSPGFGTCFECEKEIPFARILIMPESTLCVACAEDKERT